MASPFQAATLVARPLYPNAIAWSDENLVAIATGHIVTILNPASLLGPRGLITLPPIKPFSIGVVSREDLLTGCLLPICLSRGTKPCVRSISWSHLGLACNSGCLLAVCSTEGRVKLYRQPIFEFCAEWVEVVDISDLLFDHLVQTEFGKVDMPSIKASSEQTAEYHKESGCASHLPYSMSNKRQKQRILNISCDTADLEDDISYLERNKAVNSSCTPLKEKRLITDSKAFPCSFKKNTSVEVLKQNGTQRAWVNGMIKCIKGAKALVQYPEAGMSGKKEEWFEINRNSDKTKVSVVRDGIKPDLSSLSPKVRPYMDAGNLPEEICMLKFHDLEGILSNEQAVEAWLDERTYSSSQKSQPTRILMNK